GMYPDTLKESWVYNYASNNLQVVTYGSNNASGINELSVKINDVEYNIRNINKACRNNTINFIAFDRETANPYLSFGDISSSQIDLKSCGKSPYLINSFAFSEIETGTRDLQTYLDGVSAGDSVVVFTIGNVNFLSWTAGMKAKMTELGFNATFITDNGLTTGAPMIGYGAKGGVVGSAKVVIPTTLPLADQQLIYLHKVEGKSIHGRLTSPKIGPALSWGSFFKNLKGLDDPVTDKNSVRIFSQTGALQTEHLSSVLPGVNDLSFVDPLLYPVVQLELSTSDSIGNTPVQAKRWTVLYTPSPEGVVWGGPELVTPLQKSEGEPVALTFYFMNLSPYYFPDSLTVNYEVVNQGSGARSLQQVRIIAPLPGDTTAFDLNFITKGFQGKNDLDLMVNPGVTPEQFLGNNQIKLNGFMEVGGDFFNPLIDVSFDGRKILNGDLVSSTPLITINLEDDNAYLPLSDTTFLDFYMAEEGGTYKRVSYSQLGVTWEVKNGGKHLVVNYESGYLNTGSYRLKVVAKDASGNYAGAEPYEIQFEVVNESTITRFYPYPNPFTDKMRFVFTITGDAIPDEFSIRILTITGRVVREIGLSEFGPIYVGNNMSEFYWDGTDQNGDRLGNGVYLYKVTARINGKEVDLNAKHGDRGFKNGIGKIYLAR
ncbi:MAG: hypothetical protein OEW75_18545, partial [Cyclobacteriaceae bacterium]|nr:hypothetical protein [Cyclobacteriaceae bacterium]